MRISDWSSDVCSSDLLNLCSGGRPLPAAPPRLHPRPRDCVVLAGRGYSNKQIARALALTPRTVDGYPTEARRLFDAHDRTDLVVRAVLAGEVGLHELRRQPETSLGLFQEDDDCFSCERDYKRSRPMIHVINDPLAMKTQLLPRSL